MVLLQSSADLTRSSRSLQKIEKMQGITTTHIVGLRLHFRQDMNSAALVRLCQLFVKHEDVLDSVVPKSRRTGTALSNKYFQSNAVAVANITEGSPPSSTDSTCRSSAQKQLLEAIGACNTTKDLIDLVNPGASSSYKLNLRNVAATTTASTAQSQTTSFIEFRQHSRTSNALKIQSWLGLCGALIERAMLVTKSPLAFHSSRSLNEKFETFFSTVVKNPSLQSFYEQRQASLNGTTSSTNSNNSNRNGRKVAGSKVKHRAVANTAEPPTTKEKNCGCCFQKISAKGKSAAVCTCQENGHVFCASCIRKYATAELFENSNARLRCLALGGDCKSEYNTRQLEAILSAKLKLKLRELQYVKDVATKQGRVMW